MYKASSSEKVHLLLSRTSKSSHIIFLELFWTLVACNGAWSVQISLLIQTRTLFYWRKCYYGLCIHILIKNILMMDLFHLLSSQDINWWTGVEWITCGLLWCFYQLFGLSFWRHPFTAEHPLLRQWYISPNLMQKQTHLHLGWPEDEDIFSKFCVLGELLLCLRCFF